MRNWFKHRYQVGRFQIARWHIAVALLILSALGAAIGPESEPIGRTGHGEEIDRQFSPWDGSHYKTVAFIKARMHNPGSFQHVETRFGHFGNHLQIYVKYRGTNAFGAVVTNWILVKTDLNGNVLEILEEGF